jgi:hypothetical protein
VFWFDFVHVSLITINTKVIVPNIEYLTKVALFTSAFIITSGVNQFKISNDSALQYQPAKVNDTNFRYIGNLSIKKGIDIANVESNTNNIV